MSLISLDGRVAIVTGAGGGLGRAYALDLARLGAAVVVNDTGGGLDGSDATTRPAESVAEEIRAAGGQAVACVESVAAPEGGERIVEAAVEAFGRIDIVVNNAGILRDRSFAKLDWDDFHAVHDVHVRGAAYVTRPAFRRMCEQQYGRIIFVSSNAGTFGNFGQAAYGSAKMGVIGLSGVLSLEGERFDVRSNVVCPIARTRMTETIFAEGTAGPEEVTPMVSYLASEACRETHMVYSVGAGHYARVFTGLGSGWSSPQRQPASLDDIAARIEQINATEPFTVPLAAAEELAGLSERLKPGNPD